MCPKLSMTFAFIQTSSRMRQHVPPKSANGGCTGCAAFSCSRAVPVTLVTVASKWARTSAGLCFYTEVSGTAKPCLMPIPPLTCPSAHSLRLPGPPLIASLKPTQPGISDRQFHRTNPGGLQPCETTAPLPLQGGKDIGGNLSSC